MIIELKTANETVSSKLIRASIESEHRDVGVNASLSDIDYVQAHYIQLLLSDMKRRIAHGKEIELKVSIENQKQALDDGLKTDVETTLNNLDVEVIKTIKP